MNCKLYSKCVSMYSNGLLKSPSSYTYNVTMFAIASTVIMTP